MKPLGPIPAGFAARDGVLAVDGIKITELIAQAGATPAFVYSSGMIRARVAALRAAMPEALALHYAVKANPFAPLLRLMSTLVDGFDIASGGELGMAREAGLDPSLISFAGPGKRDIELQAAIVQGVTLNLESAAEARRALTIAEKLGKTPRLAIRVNPDFDLRGSGMKMGGGAKPFGIDTDKVPALAREIVAAGAEWRGFHIFAGSQSLDGAAIAETQGQVLDLAVQLAQQADVPLPHLNIGGGLGIPISTAIAAGPCPHWRGAGRTPEQPPRCAERHPDRDGNGPFPHRGGGVYLTTILDRKESHGDIFLVTDGGLHHQLAASGNFGTVVRRNYPVAIATRFDAEPEEEASVVGCLCTPLDRLADKGISPKPTRAMWSRCSARGLTAPLPAPRPSSGRGPRAKC
jgi:diaminopimelate decarboxylase